MRVYCAADNHPMRGLLHSMSADGVVRDGEFIADCSLRPPDGLSALTWMAQQSASVVEAAAESLQRYVNAARL